MSARDRIIETIDRYSPYLDVAEPFIERMFVLIKNKRAAKLQRLLDEAHALVDRAADAALRPKNAGEGHE